MRNPYVRDVHVFHTIGLDRTAYSHVNPITIDRPITYTACPAAAAAAAAPPRFTLDLDRLLNGVVLRSRVTFQGLSFRGLRNNTFTAWPPGIPLLLSLFNVQGDGMMSIHHSSVEVDNLPALAAALYKLPGCCSANPSRPDLQPRLAAGSPSLAAVAAAAASLPAPPHLNLSIASWVLSRTRWLQYATANPASTPSTASSAAWDFEGVTVLQAAAGAAGSAAACFGAAVGQGAVRAEDVTAVRSDAELRAALGSPSARYVQVGGSARGGGDCPGRCTVGRGGPGIEGRGGGSEGGPLSTWLAGAVAHGMQGFRFEGGWQARALGLVHA